VNRTALYEARLQVGPQLLHLALYAGVPFPRRIDFQEAAIAILPVSERIRVVLATRTLVSYVPVWRATARASCQKQLELTTRPAQSRLS
jgi:hypothetical protein